MITNNSENNPEMELSNTPLTTTEGADALMGILGSAEVEQPEDDSPLEASDDIAEDIDDEENVVESDEEEVELEASDVVSVDEQTIELEDDDYDYLVGIKSWADEGGFTDIENLKAGVLRQSDYTQKTQEHATTVKDWTEVHAQKTQELGQTLELVQGMLYGQAAEFDPVAMQALKLEDPHAYQEKVEAYMEYTARKTQVDEEIARVTQEHQAQQEVVKQQTVVEQTTLFQQMVPDAADPVKAQQINKDISEYWVGIGGDITMLDGITGAMELKVLYDAAKGASVGKEVAKAKAKAPKKAGKRLLRGGSPKSNSEKQKASRKAAKENLVNAKTSQQSKQLGEDLILQMLNGE